MRTMDAREYVLLFDGDCRICSALPRWIHALDLARRIRVEPIDASNDLLSAIPREQLFDAFHMVAPDGRVTTGGDAVPTLIEAFPIGMGFARLLRGSRPLMDRVHGFYGFLTRFRDRLVCRVDFAAKSVGSGR